VAVAGGRWTQPDQIRVADGGIFSTSIYATTLDAQQTAEQNLDVTAGNARRRGCLGRFALATVR